MHITPAYCQTCSSEILPSTFDLAHIPPCCSSPICASCVRRNPRLREYVPCLRCGDVRTRGGADAVARGMVAREERRREEEEEKEKKEKKAKEQFVLGDSDESDGDEDEGEDESEGEGDGVCGENSGGPRTDKSNAPRHSDTKDLPRDTAESETDLELVEVKHKVLRSDTLLSIARKYAADPYDLLSLNNLPPSAMTTNPAILRTRREVIVARRMVPRSKLDREPGTILDVGLPEPESPRRRKERALMRFQNVSKAERAVGEVYLALEGVGEGEEDVVEGRDGWTVGEDGEDGADISLGRTNERTTLNKIVPRTKANTNTAETTSTTTSKNKTGTNELVTEKPKVEKEKSYQPTSTIDRAIDAYFADEEWAATAPEPMRGKGKGKWRVVAAYLPAGVEVSR